MEKGFRVGLGATVGTSYATKPPMLNIDFSQSGAVVGKKLNRYFEGDVAIFPVGTGGVGIGATIPLTKNDWLCLVPRVGVGASVIPSIGASATAGLRLQPPSNGRGLYLSINASVAASYVATSERFEGLATPVFGLSIGWMERR